MDTNYIKAEHQDLHGRRSLEAVARIAGDAALPRDGVKKPSKPPLRGRKALIGEGEDINRRLYETAAFATLRDRLRSGDIRVDGSRSYRRFDAYQMPRAEVPAADASLGLPLTAVAYLAERARLLDWRLRRFAGALRRGAVEDVEIRREKVRVLPLLANVPPEAARLERHGEIETVGCGPGRRIFPLARSPTTIRCASGRFTDTVSL